MNRFFSALSDLVERFRFKKFDWYVLKQYIGPFLVTFFVAWFVLIIQFLWIWVDELIGKGLSQQIISKFMIYASANLIPMALPLAILVSSIMVMGKFGENSELTAAKSNGISLLRFFRSTIFFTILVGIFAFFYSNYIFTKTKTVADTMLADIRNLKPALLIKPNQFYNGISGTSIRIDAKNEKTGELFGIKIYQHTQGTGNESITLAKRGWMTQSEDGKVLILKLDSVIQYKDQASNSFDNLKYPFYKTSFDHFEKRFDLTQFKLNERSTNPDAERMVMNIRQLNYIIDSMQQTEKQKVKVFDTSFLKLNPALVLSEKKDRMKFADTIKAMSNEDKTRLKLIRTNKLRNVKNALYTHNSDINYTASMRKLYQVERHRKFTLAISCIVLFFVGAPLGAIIRKGGIGLPMFIAVVFFIIYYVTTQIGSNLAMENTLSPLVGMWASTFIFMPLGIYLTIKAKNDSQLMNVEGWSQIISNWYQKYVDRK